MRVEGNCQIYYIKKEKVKAKGKENNINWKMKQRKNNQLNNRKEKKKEERTKSFLLILY